MGDERKAVGSEPPTALLSEHTQYNQQNQTLNQHDCRHREHYLFRGDLLAELSSLKARLFVALPRLQFAAALCEISGSILTLRVFHLMHRGTARNGPAFSFWLPWSQAPVPTPPQLGSRQPRIFKLNIAHEGGARRTLRNCRTSYSDETGIAVPAFRKWRVGRKSP